MSTKNGIEIEREGIGHAISDNTLAVPVYQRSYKWEEEQIRVLFEDLANAQASGNSDYFLGSIVVTKGANGVPEVVDGQQRLATVTILIAAIRDYFHSQNDDVAATEYERTYLLTRDMRTREVVPKLRLNEYDFDFFKKRVLSRPGSPDRKVAATKESHQNIDRAAELASQFIRQIVRPYKESDRSNRLLDWLDFLRDRTTVIWVTVQEDQDAFLIFETLNDRGLDLSIADLLKNHLFRLAGDRIKEAQSRWTAMMGALETLSRPNITVTYIRHLWGSMHGTVRERVLFSTLKEQIKSKQAAVDFASALGEEANIYASLVNPESQFWNQYGTPTREHMRTLVTLQAEQIRPLLLAIAKHFSVPEARKAFRLAVSWSVRYLIVGGGGASGTEKLYSERAVQIRKGDVSTTTQLAYSMRQSVPTDAEFEAAFSVARVSQAHLARYYLRAIQAHAAGDSEPELVPNSDETQINLEHILPQNPGFEWDHVDTDMATVLTKRIGNLVLMKYTVNSTIGRSSFSEKAKKFAQSSYTLTAEVAQHTKWDADEINERQRRLAKLAVQTWPLKVR